ncbi:MAG: helix-hairpin-helix domain-containing protein [Bacteroidales bacterium]|nr:helix-hairpin-helix domain-containing protein [Bacteroidales bacterium]
MEKQNKQWVRLGKNLSTLIGIVMILIFFYVYRPVRDDNAEFVGDSLRTVTDSIPVLKTVAENVVIDPNVATYEQFLDAGFSAKQAKHCLNYRNKGGHFRKKEDLKKIYSISEQDYDRLVSHISIPEKKTKQSNIFQKEEKKPENQNKKIFRVNINTCDTTELKQIPGIGGFRAKKIIERREKLGGFYAVEQLYTIYSLDSLMVEAIREYIIIDTNQIKKININTATFKEINNHPLISYEQTKNIVEYRKIVGEIKDVEELRTNHIVNPDDFEILQFYIKTFD